MYSKPMWNLLSSEHSMLTGIGHRTTTEIWHLQEKCDL